MTHCNLEAAAVKVELLQLNLAKSRGKKGEQGERAGERTEQIDSFVRSLSYRSLGERLFMP